MPLDHFPVDVTIDGVLQRVCRVVEVGERVLVFKTSQALPEVVAEATLLDHPDPRRALGQLHTDAGTWQVTRTGHCGCRDPLRRLSRERLLALAGVA